MLFNRLSFFCVVFVFILVVIYFVSVPNTNELSVHDLQVRQHIQWGTNMMGIETISKEFYSEINVAVMDSGVNFNHSDFETKIKDGFNAIDPDRKPWDDNGHGTLVTGILASQNNSSGILGIIPEANIFPVKVLDEFGEGEISDVVEGIEWCINNNIHIINMSFSLNYDDFRLRKAINKALDTGIIIVASARNGRDQNVGYPASYEGVFSIVAVDKKLNIYEESSTGKVDFAAPGVDVFSTAEDGGYQNIDGNSIATPYITGVIALLMSEISEPITYQKIINHLSSNLQDLGEEGIDSVYGHGFIKF